MQIEFTNLDAFQKSVSAAVQKVTADQKLINTVTAEAITIIKERTAKGLDSSGEGFKPYSSKPCYFSTNSKYNTNRLAPSGGRTTKSGKSMYFGGGYKQYKNQISGDKVTLSNLSTMMNSLTFKGSGNERTIYFENAGSRKVSNASLAAIHHQGLGKNPARPFFEIKRQEELDRLKRLWERLANEQSPK